VECEAAILTYSSFSLRYSTAAAAAAAARRSHAHWTKEKKIVEKKDFFRLSFV
jgi:hypothetical protein